MGARSAAEEERTGPEDGLFLAQADAQALPFREGEIACVWWGLGMHLVKDARAALKDLFRVLKSGGRLVATTRLDHFPPEELARLATAVGFEVVNVHIPRYSIIALQAIRP